jgi:hypothetical protein
MRKNLLEFLFGPEALPKSEDLGEQIVRLFEEADAVETEEVVANKKPLATALKSIGISAEVEACPGWCLIKCDDEACYREYMEKLRTADAMTKLAEQGWVMAQCGDTGMSNEAPDFKIGFIEIKTAETGEDDKPDETIKELNKQGREDASTEQDRDDKLNPVENPDSEMGGKKEGVGKAADGKDPEGKPKGSTKSESLSEGGHKAGCQCGFCKNKGSFGKKKEGEKEGDKEGEKSEKDESKAQALVRRMLEMTTASGVPPLESPMNVPGKPKRKRDPRNDRPLSDSEKGPLKGYMQREPKYLRDPNPNADKTKPELKCPKCGASSKEHHIDRAFAHRLNKCWNCKTAF